MKTLYIDHNLFLTKKQRYDLFYGKSIKIVGVKISTFDHDKFKFDNKEVFCIYHVIPKKNVFKSLEKTKNGYKLYLKNRKVKNIFNFNFFKKTEKNNDVTNLLDFKDGGAEWMFFQEEEYKLNYKIIHKLEIKTIELLKESFI